MLSTGNLKTPIGNDVAGRAVQFASKYLRSDDKADESVVRAVVKDVDFHFDDKDATFWQGKGLDGKLSELLQAVSKSGKIAGEAGK